MSIEIICQGDCPHCGRKIHVSWEDHGSGEASWRRCRACSWADVIDPRARVPHKCPQCRGPLEVWDENRCPGCDRPIQLTGSQAYN